METLLRKYFWAIDLLVIALCAVFTARASATLIEPYLGRLAPLAKRASRPPPQRSTTIYSKQIEEILKRNIFCSTCPPIGSNGQVVAAAPAVPELQKTTLPLKLLAVMYAPTDPKWSMAIIRDTERKSAGLMGRLTGLMSPIVSPGSRWGGLTTGPATAGWCEVVPPRSAKTA